LKRLFDIFFSITGLVFLLPVLVAIALVIRIKMGKPILFSQVRPGKNQSPFVMYKFRTMWDAYSSDGKLLPDSQRVTALGQFLRSTSLDELPELWNVLRGDLSFVGPRPLLVEYVPLYNDKQKMRHNVRPGITGWAQVNGRNAISWEEKFNLDVWYLENQSFLLDMKIIWMTIKKVIAREGISADDHATMPKFTGSQDLDK